jgi:hypothetical protein
MSGIARGRLTEERKSWRKNHPHVCTNHYFYSFLVLSFESVIVLSICLILIGLVFFFCFCFLVVWFRVLLRSRRHYLMVLWIWWSGIVLFLEKLGFVIYFDFSSVYLLIIWMKFLSFFVKLIFVVLFCEIWAFSCEFRLFYKQPMLVIGNYYC